MHGIRGCVIHPGETVTPMQRARPKPPSPEDQAKDAEDGGPGPRVRFVAESRRRTCA